MLLAEPNSSIDKQLTGNATSRGGSLQAMNDFAGARIAAEEAISRLKNFERAYHLAQVHRLNAMLQQGAHQQVVDSIDHLLANEISSLPRFDS